MEFHLFTEDRAYFNAGGYLKSSAKICEYLISNKKILNALEILLLITNDKLLT